MSVQCTVDAAFMANELHEGTPHPLGIENQLFFNVRCHSCMLDNKKLSRGLHHVWGSLQRFSPFSKSIFQMRAIYLAMTLHGTPCIHMTCVVHASACQDQSRKIMQISATCIQYHGVNSNPKTEIACVVASEWTCSNDPLVYHLLSNINFHVWNTAIVHV